MKVSNGLALAALGVSPTGLTAQIPESTPITLGAVYTGEVWSPFKGAVRDGHVHAHNLDLTLSVPPDQLGVAGLSAFVYGLGNAGLNASEFVGDAQTLSNISTPPAWRVYEAWVQQNFGKGRWSFLAGLYDLNSEFDVTHTSGLFLNSSFGIGPDYSQSGSNGPSIFPVTSLSLRIQNRPTDSFYWQAAVLDASPGHPARQNGIQIGLSRADGALFAVEMGFLGAPEAEADGDLVGRGAEAAFTGRIAVGAWHYTNRFPSIDPADAPGLSRGAYLIGERVLFSEEDGAGSLSGFTRVGFASGGVNRFSGYVGAGLTYTGLFPQRGDDELGLAVGAAMNGDQYRRVQDAAGQFTDPTEIALELTYRLPLGSWLVLQPDLQWIFNPDTDARRSSAAVIGIRLETEFQVEGRP